MYPGRSAKEYTMDSERVHQWKADVVAGKYRNVGRDVRAALELDQVMHFMVRHWLTEASKALEQRRVDPRRVQTCFDEALMVLCPNLNWADSD
jgi:Arc/MetJ-type ribon-helix-helix transcriptional regulator